MTVLTAAAVLLTASMSLIRDEPSYLFLGLALLAATAACGDLASVPYNAMLNNCRRRRHPAGSPDSVRPQAISVVSCCWLIVYFGFIMGDGPTRGLLGVSVDDGYNVRVAMLVTALWFAMLALPLLFTAHHILPPDATAHVPVGALGAYRQLWSDISAEWRRDRNLVYYLVASAIFRDGLAGVFTFGAVLGVSVYGISQADVLIFGVAVSVVAAVGAVLGGHVDDRIGSKPVIVGSLTAMIAVGLTLLALSGPVAFWVCGLLLCLFLGPTQASARTLLLRMSADGQGRCGVRPLHHDGAGGVVPGAVAVLRVRRRLRLRSRRIGRHLRGARRGAAGHAGGARRRSDEPGLVADRCADRQAGAGALC